MGKTSIMIRVPATVGNFAGAVNCAALALEPTLNVKVTPRVDGHVGIRYFGENGERVPRDQSNLIVQAMGAALRLRGREFTGADFEIYSSVPVAVGLGSSTAAVLAGLIAADSLFRLGLDEKTMFDLAAIYESRRDNLRAAWTGGFVAGVEDQPWPNYQRTAVPENFVLSVVVPETHLANGARRDLPAEQPSGKDHFRRAAVMAEFFARPEDRRSPDLKTLLPRTCEKAVPGIEEALQVRLPGLLSVFVCGSGPAVGILTQEDLAAAIQAVRESFARHGVASKAVGFRPSNTGAREWNAVPPEVTLPTARALASPLGSTFAKSTLRPA